MKNIENKLVRQQIIYWTLLFVAITTAILFETGVMSEGGLAIYNINNYVIEVAGILLALALIPLANKRFSSSMKKVENADDATFLNTCRRELEIRIALLFVVLMTNTGLYYGSGQQHMVYWALIGLVAYIFGYPTNKYLHRDKE